MFPLLIENAMLCNKVRHSLCLMESFVDPSESHLQFPCDMYPLLIKNVMLCNKVRHRFME